VETSATYQLMLTASRPGMFPARISARLSRKSRHRGGCIERAQQLMEWLMTSMPCRTGGNFNDDRGGSADISEVVIVNDNDLLYAAATGWYLIKNRATPLHSAVYRGDLRVSCCF
jgi:hypothetical protein